MENNRKTTKTRTSVQTQEPEFAKATTRWGEIFLLLLLFALPAIGQTVNGSIGGIVKDSTGAAVSGATVTATNVVTAVERPTTTLDDGTYILPQLEPGVYTVTTAKQGFATQTMRDLKLEVNERATADFHLAVGAATATVEVSATSSVLNTSDATIATTVEHQEIVDLPLNGRNFTTLILLAPGSSPMGASQQGAFTVNTGQAFTSNNGERPQQNNYTLDGLLNNQIYMNVWAIAPPPDAISEFNVQSHMTDPQFSISSGANVNVDTKAGTDKYHGTLWEFVRNDKAGNALPPFTPANTPSSPYKQNQYGLWLGGPVIKNHIWASGYWEAYSNRSTNPFTATVPTAAEIAGDFSQLKYTNGPNAGQMLPIYDPYTSVGTPGNVTRIQYGPNDTYASSSALNVIPQSELDPAMHAYFKTLYPLPTVDPLDPNVPNNFVQNAGSAADTGQEGIRVDYKITDKDSLFGRFNRLNAHQFSPQYLPDNLSGNTNYVRQVAIGYTRVFNSTTILNARWGYQDTNYSSGNKPAPASLLNSWPGLNAFYPENYQAGLIPWTYAGIGIIAGYGQVLYPFGPETLNQGDLDFSTVRGKHTINIGMMLFHITSFDSSIGALEGFSKNGTNLTGNVSNGAGYELAEAVLGMSSIWLGTEGNSDANEDTLWKAGYIQDQWQVNRRLNVNIGLRYDYVPPPANGTVRSAVNPFDGVLEVSGPVPGFFKQGNVPSTFFYPQHTGFQPRFGFAYRATDKTVVRGGFTVFDDHNNTLVQESQNIRLSWPDSYPLYNALSGKDTGKPVFTASTLPTASQILALDGGVGKPTSGYMEDPHAGIPYSMEFNLGVERQLTNSILLDVDYVGAQNKKQWVSGTGNICPTPVALPATPCVQFPAQSPSEIEDLNEGYGQYNSLQIKATQRFHNGLTFLTAYTYGKATDEGSGGQDSHIQNIYNLKGEYEPANFDLKHNFTFGGTYELPLGRGKAVLGNMNRGADMAIGGWNLGGIVSSHSGFPFNIISGADYANVNIDGGAGSERPNLVGNPQIGFKHTANGLQWFNPAAFAPPPSGQFGQLKGNAFYGPGYNDTDLSLFKDFALTERLKFILRAETFNAFNHTNYGQPATNLQSSAGFGIIASSVGNQRLMQFGAKLVF